MPDTLIIPPINPLHFTGGATPNPLYQSRHIDDFPFADTIRPEQQPTEFYQPFLSIDKLCLHVRSNNPVWIVFECSDGSESLPIGLDQRQQDANNAGLYIYETALTISDFVPEGYYRVRLYSGTLTAWSNPIIIDDNLSGTILVEYKNYRYFSDVIFETGFSPSLRLYGCNPYKTPGQKITQYENQTLTMTTTDYKPLRVFELNVGAAEGVPDFFIDKMNLVVGCSFLKVDGRFYALNEAAKWEEFAEEEYPMRGWKVELRETGDPTSTITTTGLVITGTGIIMGTQYNGNNAIVDSGGGATDTGGTTNINTTVGTYDYTATGGEYVLHTAKLGKTAVGLFRATNVQLLTSGIPNSSQAVYDSVSGDITLGSPAGPGEYFLFQFQ